VPQQCGTEYFLISGRGGDALTFRRHPEAAAKRLSKDVGRDVRAVALRGSLRFAPQGDENKMLRRVGEK
jgi:hypothetical protein